MASIISLCLTASIFSLCSWSFFSSYKSLEKFFSRVFYLSFIAYILLIVSSFFSFGLSSPMLPFRDLLGLSLTGIVFVWFKKKKLSVWLGSTLIILISLFSYRWTQMDYTFALNSKTDDQTSQLKESTIGSDAELLVELYDQKDLRKLENLLLAFEVEISPAFNPARGEITDLDDYYTVDILDDDPSSITKVIDLLERNEFVEWQERNEAYKIEFIPSKIKYEQRLKSAVINDPLVNEQWAAKALQFHEYLSYINSAKKKPKKVAQLYILDTGIDGSHEDLNANYKSLKSSYDVDKMGHGTHCAGIAAAVTNNKKGIASIVPNEQFVNVTSIKVLGAFGGATQKTIIKGMIEAIDNGADVISMSLGGKSTQIRQKAYNEVSSYALKHNVIIVAAAGNSAADAAKYSPANTKNVIAVAALDKDLKKASFSNFTDNIEFALSAPGKDILSTFPNNSYKSLSGTSMACPYVSGTIAVMKSIKPDLTIFQAYELLNSTGMQTMSQNATGTLINPKDALSRL